MTRKNSNPLTDVVVVGATDMFKLTNAPYHEELRARGIGNTYYAKVYEPVAYTARHMAKSDESKRLVRWVVNLSNGMKVSREGVLRLRAPEVWDRVQPMVAKLRGEKLEQAMAKALWDAITPEEREAMVASVDLASYVEGRSIREAREDLFADLVESKSPLAHIDAEWSKRLRREFVRAAFGTETPAWEALTWPEFVRFQAFLGGNQHDLSAYENPRTMPLTVRGKNGLSVHESWVMHNGLSEIASYARLARPQFAEEVLSVVIERLGGPPGPGETERFPPASDLAARNRQHALRDARVARIADVGCDLMGFLWNNSHTGDEGWLWHADRIGVDLKKRREAGA